jgi:hypothetical protein
LQVRQNGRIGLYERSAATARTANLELYRIKRVHVLQAAIVLRTIPVARATALTPPYPALRASAARKQAPFALAKTRTHSLATACVIVRAGLRPSGDRYCRPATAKPYHLSLTWQLHRARTPFFKSFDDIVDHCCYAWNTLIDYPWKIRSIAQRDWGTFRSLTVKDRYEPPLFFC